MWACEAERETEVIVVASTLCRQDLVSFISLLKCPWLPKKRKRRWKWWYHCQHDCCSTLSSMAVNEYSNPFKSGDLNFSIKDCKWALFQSLQLIILDILLSSKFGLKPTLLILCICIKIFNFCCSKYIYNSYLTPLTFQLLLYLEKKIMIELIVLKFQSKIIILWKKKKREIIHEDY